MCRACAASALRATTSAGASSRTRIADGSAQTPRLVTTESGSFGAPAPSNIARLVPTDRPVPASHRRVPRRQHQRDDDDRPPAMRRRGRVTRSDHAVAADSEVSPRRRPRTTRRTRPAACSPSGKPPSPRTRPWQCRTRWRDGGDSLGRGRGEPDSGATVTATPSDNARPSSENARGTYLRTDDRRVEQPLVDGGLELLDRRQAHGITVGGIAQLTGQRGVAGQNLRLATTVGDERQDGDRDRDQQGGSPPGRD